MSKARVHVHRASDRVFACGRPWLVLPVESRVRELDSKLLLAAVAAERGFACILGGRSEIGVSVSDLPRGVFFAKSMRFTSDLMTGLVTRLGNHVVASDEESLVRFDHPDYTAWLLSEMTFEAIRHLFAWGPSDAEMFRSYPASRSTAVHETGNPRLDLLRNDVRSIFRAKAKALRGAHGDFVLVNTNFSFVNNFVRSLNLVQRTRRGRYVVGRTGRGMSIDFAKGMARHQIEILWAFEALLPALSAAFPDRTIVLRAHPSENHDRWRSLTRGLANVRVIHEDNVVPWLMSCGVLVHNGCTTAVEAAVLGKTAIAYCPVRSRDHDYPLPNALSLQVGTVEEAVAAVDCVARGETACGGDRARLLARHLTRRQDRLCADLIVDELVRAGYLENDLPRPGRWTRAVAWTLANGRAAVKRFNARRRDHRNGDCYRRHRFPDLSAVDVGEKLSTLRETLGRFDGVAAAPAGRNMFVISRR